MIGLVRVDTTGRRPNTIPRDGRFGYYVKFESDGYWVYQGNNNPLKCGFQKEALLARTVRRESEAVLG